MQGQRTTARLRIVSQGLEDEWKAPDLRREEDRDDSRC